MTTTTAFPTATTATVFVEQIDADGVRTIAWEVVARRRTTITLRAMQPASRRCKLDFGWTEWSARSNEAGIKVVVDINDLRLDGGGKLLPTDDPYFVLAR